MKLTILVPPVSNRKIPERFFGCSYQLQPFPDLANLHLMSVLHSGEFEVDVIDAVAERMKEADFYELLQEDNSDVYIFHSVILAKGVDRECVKRIRSMNNKKHTPIFFYGPEPTRVPEDYLFDSDIVVFRGDPEVNVCRYLETGNSSGISYLKNGVPQHIPPSQEVVDVNELPIPLRTHGRLQRYATKYHNYKFKKRPHTTMMASRGCAYRCHFCVPNSMSFARELEHKKFFKKKPKPSLASSERVIAEFKQIKSEGFNSIMVMDDQFLWGKKRTLEICEGVKDLDMEWGCLSRADFLTDEDVVKNLYRAGCRTVDVGIESLRQQTLDHVKKDLKVETFYQAIDLLKKHQLEPKINIVLGLHPSETLAELKEMIGKVGELDIKNVMFTIATPFKGTEFYDYCKDHEYIIDDSDDIDPLGKCMISYPNLTNVQLEKLQKYAYFTYYCKLSRLLPRFKRYVNPRNLIEDMKIAIGIFSR